MPLFQIANKKNNNCNKYSKLNLNGTGQIFFFENNQNLRQNQKKKYNLDEWFGHFATKTVSISGNRLLSFIQLDLKLIVDKRGFSLDV